jgi:hypothetical protein
MQQTDADDEGRRGRQNFDQRRREEGDEDVRVTHRVEQRYQSHAAVGQPGMNLINING